MVRARARVGKTLRAKWRLDGLLGVGGMAAVYSATHRNGARAAIKVLHPELAVRDDVRVRFLREGYAANTVGHPGAVRVLDDDECEGVVYVVMELLEGETLAGLHERAAATLSVARVLALIGGVLDVLASAHDRGIVHRDVKPENIFVTTAGEPRLLDFGIARVLDPAAAEAAGGHLKTSQGYMLGTPAFMPPEQALGRIDEIDARSDVFAVGATLFFLLAGRVVHEARTPNETMVFAAARPAPKLATVAPGVSSDVARLVDRALEYDRDARFPDARAMRDALRRIEAGLASAARDEPIPPPPRSAAAEAGPAASGSAGPTGTRIGPAPGPPDARAPLALSTTEGMSVGSVARARVGKAPFVVGAVVTAAVGAAVAATLLSSNVAPRSSTTSSMASTSMVASTPASTNPRPSPIVGADGAHEVSSVAPWQRWVRVEPPDEAVPLGLGSESAPRNALGFRPSRGVFAPRVAYDIQSHEVSWAELDAWLATRRDREFARPRWVPEAAEDRAKWPATGVPWETASAFCVALGGALPTEEQWEFAARGASRRPHPWGDAPLDLARTRVAARRGSAPVDPVGQSAQDVSPDGRIFDLAGNAMEWTADVYRESVGRLDETWATRGGVTWRAVRGLPLDDDKPPAALPEVTAAARVARCASGACPKASAEAAEFIGFRCVKSAEARP